MATVTKSPLNAQSSIVYSWIVLKEKTPVTFSPLCVARLVSNIFSGYCLLAFRVTSFMWDGLHCHMEPNTFRGLCPPSAVQVRPFGVFSSEMWLLTGLPEGYPVLPTVTFVFLSSCPFHSRLEPLKQPFKTMASSVKHFRQAIMQKIKGHPVYIRVCLESVRTLPPRGD